MIVHGKVYSSSEESSSNDVLVEILFNHQINSEILKHFISVVWQCNFDIDSCSGILRSMNPGSDPVEFTFTRQQEKTPSDNTGPTSDHTSGGGEIINFQKKVFLLFFVTSGFVCFIKKHT